MREKLGKIDSLHLEKVFTQKTGAPNPKVIQGPKFGVDTAIVRLNRDKGLVIASDPASLIPSLGLKESAWLSVVLTANDIATSGFLPEYGQFVLNLPSSISTNELNQYWEHIHLFCLEMGISITGGHTGFGDIGNSTVSGGVTLFAEADLTLVKSTAFVQPDLDLLVTKSAALSGTALLAKSFPKYTIANLGVAAQSELADSFYQMSVLSEVKKIRENESVFKGVVALHDVTEGGILGAVIELCEAGEVGVIIDKNQIPLGANQKEICRLFSIDPYRSLGAGSLLIACEKESTQELIRVLESTGIQTSKIGETRENKKERYLRSESGKQELVYIEEDPYWEAFFKAITKKIH